MMDIRGGVGKEGGIGMLFLLLLFIVPSAIGVYFLLKPPLHIENEADSKSVMSIATPFKSVEEIPIAADIYSMIEKANR